MFFAKKNLLVVLTILQKCLLSHFSLTVEIFSKFQILAVLEAFTKHCAEWVQVCCGIHEGDHFHVINTNFS